MSESSVGQENPILVFDVDLLADCVGTDAVHALAIVRVKSLVDDLSGRCTMLRIEIEQPEHFC